MKNLITKIIIPTILISTVMFTSVVSAQSLHNSLTTTKKIATIHHLQTVSHKVALKKVSKNKKTISHKVVLKKARKVVQHSGAQA